MNYAVIKILMVFAAVLILNRLKLNLGMALILGGIGLNLWGGLTVQITVSNLGNAFLNTELWFFILVMALIIEVDHYMTEEKNSAEIVAATQRWGGKHGRALTLMSLPAVMGLIPSPAGALFSAPFVEQASGREDGSPEWKTAVNYWFRHLWEYWWPLYPGVIIAMSVFSMIPSWQFVSVQIPYTILSITLGYLFLVRSHIPRLAGISVNTEGDNRRAFFLLTPLLIVLASLFVLPLPLSRILPGMNMQVRKLLAVVLGLVMALLLIVWDGRRGKGGPTVSTGRKMFSTLFTRSSLSIQFSLVGVLVFQFMLEKSGLLPAAGKELVSSGIPLVIAVAILPFLGGMITGIASGFTGTAFPLLVGLMNTEGSGLTPLSTLVLGYGFGYVGLLLSPVHLCLLVTRDYFSATLSKVYMQLLPGVAVILIYSIVVHFVLRVLGW
ncbi:MAG: hypothetical protein A2283_09115 [Lentisphaerae bacterium RIFOXYA12_FULL_48_11]|nr:MAG: hypothetical protein A2283_09115 [Lentisphaerae bacterium RIFOXYA12_FULL_48_11]